MQPIVIIPARTGSKGVPNKNWRLLCGKTPVQRAIDCCREAGLTNIYLSTDHPNPTVQDVEVVYAPEVHLETNSALDVVSRVLSVATVGDVLLYVQPTQPLRRAAHLHDALHRLGEGAGRVASIVECEPAAKLVYRFGEPVIPQRAERRQDAAPTYYYDGTFYGCWVTDFKQYRTLTAGADLVVIPKSESCRLDDLEDWKIAERLIGSPSGPSSDPW